MSPWINYSSFPSLGIHICKGSQDMKVAIFIVYKISFFVWLLITIWIHFLSLYIYVCVCGGGGGGSLAKSCLTWKLWTIALQDSLSMGFSRQEHWSGCQALLQGTFPTQGSNPCLLHGRRNFAVWAPREPKNTGVGSLSLLQGIFPTQESLPGRFFTRWTTREALPLPAGPY